MKNLKRFNEGWFSSKSRKDDDIAEKILNHIEDAKSKAETLRLDIEYFGNEYDCLKFRVNELLIEVIGRVKHNGWPWNFRTSPDNVDWQGLFIDGRKLNVSNKLIVKIYNKIDFIYKKHKQRESDEKERELDAQKNEIREKL